MYYDYDYHILSQSNFTYDLEANVVVKFKHKPYCWK